MTARVAVGSTETGVGRGVIRVGIWVTAVLVGIGIGVGADFSSMGVGVGGRTDLDVTYFVLKSQ